MLKFLSTLFKPRSKQTAEELPNFDTTYERFDDVAGLDASNLPTPNSPSNHYSYAPHFKFPPKFVPDEFLQQMIDRFYIFNRAWNENRIQSLEIYVSDSIFKEGLKVRNNLSNVNVELIEVNCKLITANFDGQTAKVSVMLSGRYFDKYKEQELEFKEKWNLERTYLIDDALWLIVGIKSTF